MKAITNQTFAAIRYFLTYSIQKSPQTIIFQSFEPEQIHLPDRWWANRWKGPCDAAELHTKLVSGPWVCIVFSIYYFQGFL